MKRYIKLLLLFVLLTSCNIVNEYSPTSRTIDSKTLPSRNIEPTTLASKFDLDTQAYEAVYYSILNDALVSSSEAEIEHLLIVTEYEELKLILENEPVLNIVYIHPNNVETIPDSWLRQIYEDEKVIVALNTPISVLTAKIGTWTSVDDIDMSKSYDRLGMSMLYQINRPGQELIKGETSEFLSSFSAIANVVRNSLNKVDDFDPALHTPTIKEPDGD